MVRQTIISGHASSAAKQFQQLILKFFILERVYKWIDAAVDKDCDDREMIEGAVEIGVEAEVVHRVVDLIAGPTENETDADDQQRAYDVVARAQHFLFAPLRCRLVSPACCCCCCCGNARPQCQSDLRVGIGDQDQWQKELQEHGEDSNSSLGQFVWVLTVDSTRAIDYASCWDHVGRVVTKANHPNNRDRHNNPGLDCAAFHVPDRMNNREEPLEGQGHQIVRGRHKEAPDGEVCHPESTERLAARERPDGVDVPDV